MTYMLKASKIRIYPNKTQERLIIKTMGACRWIYNQYLGYNKEQHSLGYKFVSGYDFDKLVTQLKKTDERYSWLIGVPTKAIKYSIRTAEFAFKRFFKGKSRFPRFKSRKDRVNSYYFVKDNIHFDTGIKNRIKIPNLKSIRITQRNQLPDETKIVSGRVILDHGKYFVSFIYETDREFKVINSSGIGIDLGIKNYLSISDKYDNYYHVNNFIFDDNYQRYEAKIKVVKASVDGGSYEELIDKFYLPSTTEVGLANENSIAEGALFPYFSSNTQRIKSKSGGSASYWWLRTPYSSLSGHVRHVSSSDALYNSVACNALGVAPVCNII